MIRFLIDADLPRSACAELRQLGRVAEDIRDLDLSAATDETVLHYARIHGYTLLSADKGFSNLLRFPLGTHHGIMVARFPRHMSARAKVRLLLGWISMLQEEDIDGNLLILGPKGVRIRRAKSS